MRNGKHGAIGRYLASPVAFLARQLKRSAPSGSSFPLLRRFISKVN